MTLMTPITPPPPTAPSAAPDAPAPPPPTAATAATAPTAPAAVPAPAAPTAPPPQTLADIQAELTDCRRCPLCETRTNVVFGVGNPTAEVMFIGEAPGKQEDLGAEPFIGAAGQYLNSLLALAGLTRQEIYIANVLKCRPPENRDPRPEEIELCTPFLRNQVRAINPLILVTLGNFATRFILKTDRGITGLRGQIHLAGRFSVLPIFHPAAAIYDRSKEAIMEADFKLLGRLIKMRREEQAHRNPPPPQMPKAALATGPRLSTSPPAAAAAELSASTTDAAAAVEVATPAGVSADPAAMAAAVEVATAGHIDPPRFVTSPKAEEWPAQERLL